VGGVGFAKSISLQIGEIETDEPNLRTPRPFAAPRKGQFAGEKGLGSVNQPFWGQ
jgi:hypothetical protein